MRHLYRSKHLTTILNRFGHCESYEFAQELETAVATAIDLNDSTLTPQIVSGTENIVFHSEWDNLNKITTNLAGNNFVNSTGGIMLQEAKVCLMVYFKIPISLERRDITIDMKGVVLGYSWGGNQGSRNVEYKCVCLFMGMEWYHLQKTMQKRRYVCFSPCLSFDFPLRLSYNFLPSDCQSFCTTETYSSLPTTQ